MISNRVIWARTRDELVRAIEELGFPAELGEAIAKHLGSPKAMERMIAYLNNQANARYSEILYYGLEGLDEE